MCDAVTGTAGILGTSLVRTLAVDGHEGCAVDHGTANVATPDSDGVWHLNTVGPRSVAEAALAVEVRRVVHCSSVHSFNATKGDHIDDSPVRATDPKLPVYDRSKWRGEETIRDLIECFANQGVPDRRKMNQRRSFAPADPWASGLPSGLHFQTGRAFNRQQTQQLLGMPVFGIEPDRLDGV